VGKEVKYMSHNEFDLSPWPVGVNPAEVRQELAEANARQLLTEKFGVSQEGLAASGSSALEVLHQFETVSVPDSMWSTLFSE
jgi:hypothetical protein